MLILQSERGKEGDKGKRVGESVIEEERKRVFSSEGASDEGRNW